MNGFLGCLFILIFAAFFFVLGIVRMLHSLLTGGKSNTFNPFYTNRSRRQNFGGTHFGQNGTNETFRDAGLELDATGITHRDSYSQNSKRGGEKIFAKNEGTYVDFEEVK